MTFEDIRACVVVVAFVALLVYIICKYYTIIRNITNDFAERDQLDYWFYTTKQFILKELGYVVSISAFRGIRGGKTMTMCGLSHALTDVIVEKCQRYISWFRSRFIELDYTIVNNIINDGFTKQLSVKAISNLIVKASEPNYFQGLLDDHINRRPKLGLLQDYVEDYLSLLEYDFTWCNVYFHNRITGKDARLFKDEDMNLKDIYQSGQYVLRRNSVFMFDEETLGERQSQNFQKLQKTDSGRDICYRLFGQMMKEKSYIVTTAQRSSRIYKNLRELYNSFIDIRKFEVKGELKYCTELIYRVQNFSDWLSRLRQKFIFNHDMKMFYEEKFNWGKARSRALDDVIDYFKAGSYMSVNANVCHKEDYVGKDADNLHSVNFEFVFPIRYCFGVYDTHYFKFVHDVLQQRSSGNRERIEKNMDEDEKRQKASEVLKKQEQKDDWEREDY